MKWNELKMKQQRHKIYLDLAKISSLPFKLEVQAFLLPRIGLNLFWQLTMIFVYREKKEEEISPLENRIHPNPKKKKITRAIFASLLLSPSTFAYHFSTASLGVSVVLGKILRLIEENKTIASAPPVGMKYNSQREKMPRTSKSKCCDARAGHRPTRSCKVLQHSFSKLSIDCEPSKQVRTCSANLPWGFH
uniref:Uncharacterized protein n=1 Tax=Salix viminalis TaxID=40686 RepID=A0A6N2LZ47_SALVM